MSTIYNSAPPNCNGSSADLAATSAAAIKHWNPSATSGLYYIRPNGYSTPFQVLCDMDTLDEYGQSGWMLVGSWTTAQNWTLSANTSSNVFGTTAMDCASSNFGNVNINKFRITANATALGSTPMADWYYNYNNKVMWKQVWSPDGINYQYYLSTPTTGVQRCSLRMFDYSYNIKFGYKNPEHNYNNIADYGYTNTRNADGTGNIGGSNASVNGFCNYWNALTSPGLAFGVFNLSYTGSFVLGDVPVCDGTLAIPIKGAGVITSGQDVDTNISVKVGRDDVVTWTTAATDAIATSTAAINVPLWWWIK